MCSSKAIMFAGISSTQLILSICLVQMFLFWYCCYALQEIPAIAAAHEIVFGAIAITFMDIWGDLGLLISHPQSFIDEKSKYIIRVLAITYTDQLIRLFGISLYDRFQPHFFLDDYLDLSNCIEPMFAEIISWLSNIFKMFQIAKNALLAALRSLADVPSPATVDDSHDNFLLPEPTSTASHHTTHTNIFEVQSTSTKVVEIDTANDPEPDHEPNAGESSKARQALVLRSPESRSSSNVSNKQTYSKGEKVSREFEVNIASTPTRNMDTRVIIQEDEHGFHAIYREEIEIAPEPIVKVVVDNTTETRLHQALEENQKLIDYIKAKEKYYPKGKRAKEDMANRLESLEKELEETKESKDSLERQSNNLEENLAHELKVKEQVEMDLKAAKKRKEELKNDIATAESDIRVLKESKESLNDRLSTNEEKLKVMEEAKGKIEQQLTRTKDDLREEVKKELINQYKTTQDQLEADLEIEKESKGSIEKELGAAKTSLQEEIEKKIRATNELKTMADDLKAVKETKKDVEKELKLVQDELELEKESKEKTKTMLDSAEIELNSEQQLKETAKKQLEATHSELKTTIQQKEKAESDARSLGEMNKSLGEELATFRRKYNTEVQAKDTAESNLRLAAEQLRDYSQCKQSLQDHINAVSGYESSISSLSNEVNTLRSYKDRFEQLQKDMASEKENVVRLEDELNKYETQFNSQNHKIQTQNGTINSLQDTIRIFQATTVPGLQKTLFDQKTQIDSLKRDMKAYEQCKQSNIQLQGELANEKHLRQLAEFSASQADRLATMLEDTRKKYDQLDVEFRQRGAEIEYKNGASENLRQTLQTERSKNRNLHKRIEEMKAVSNQGSTNPTVPGPKRTPEVLTDIPSAVLEMQQKKDEELALKQGIIESLQARIEHEEFGAKLDPKVEWFPVLKRCEKKYQDNHNKTLKEKRDLRLERDQARLELQKLKEFYEGGEEEETSEKRNKKR